ncbi:DNA ligase 1-like isoform X1 [Branchiostoma lanceolatum]|uniref:DNA ligase 1-like isoform X1 n=1 Tax=Branchiostoma lanceolatum TaxID=7740 RepID=UPI003456847C
MSTSSGFFENSPCSSLAEGECDGSLLNFNHATPASTISPSGSDLAPGDSPCQPHNNHDSTVTDNIDKDSVVKEQRDLGHQGNYKPYDTSVSESSHGGGLPVSDVHTNQPSTMPGQPGVAGTQEYRPTPIAELKKRHATGVDVKVQEHLSSEYDPNVTWPSTSIGTSVWAHSASITDLDMSDARQEPTVSKYSQAFEYHGTDMEYDPIVNYRCSTFAKQQKRNLQDISEDVGSAQPVSKERKMGQDHHTSSDNSQDNSDLIEDTVADNLSNNEDIKLIMSDSASETDFNNNDQINLRGSDSDPAMSETAAGLHLSRRENEMLESVENSTKNIAKKVNYKQNAGQQPSKVKRLKKKRVRNLFHDNVLKSGSKLESTDKNFLKQSICVKRVFDEKAPSHCLPQEREKDVSIIDLVSEDMSDWEENKLESTDKNYLKPSICVKRGFDEEAPSHRLPQEKEKDDSIIDLVSEDMSDWEENKLRNASSTSDEYNAVYSYLVKEERKRMKYLKHSVTQTKGGIIKISDSYNPKLAENMDWIKTKKTHENRKEFSVKDKGKSRYSSYSYSVPQNSMS